MLEKGIINQMTMVELRNYTSLLLAQQERFQNMIQSQDAIINSLLTMYNTQTAKESALITLNVKTDAVRGMEMEMERKYQAEALAERGE